MLRAISRRGLILLASPVLLSGTAAIGLVWSSPESLLAPQTTRESARLLQARGDVQGAERILRETPGAEARFLLGRLLAQQGRWNEAREPLVESLAIKERRTEALRLLAQGSMTSRDWESARRHLTQLEQAEPRDPTVSKALAFSLLQSGDALGSISAAQRGLALEPEDGELVRLMSEAAESAADLGPSMGAHPRTKHGRRNR